MSYVVLARKWRPQTFSDLVGQGHVSQTLANAIANDRVAHAFLFTGVRGVGKTTSARILAKALNCMSSDGPTAEPCLECSACKEITDGRDVDVQEIDGASYTGVDEVRRLQESLPYRPNRDRFKIYIVDEVHMLSQSAWNAFLKTLEEPPPHVKFIFATTEVHKVPVTILSRVQRFDFKLIPTKLIMDRLAYVLEQENVKADTAALTIVAREAAGSMRDAMSLLDQVLAWSTKELTGDDVARVLGVASRQAVHELAESLISGDVEAALNHVAGLANQGFEMGNVARDVLALLRDIVVCASCSNFQELLDLPDEELGSVQRLAEHSTDDLLRLHQGFSAGYDSVATSAQPRAALEMLLVRLARRPPLIPVDDLIERLIGLEKRLHGGRGGGGRASGPPAAGRGSGSPVAHRGPPAAAPAAGRSLERSGASAPQEATAPRERAAGASAPSNPPEPPAPEPPAPKPPPPKSPAPARQASADSSLRQSPESLAPDSPESESPESEIESETESLAPASPVPAPDANPSGHSSSAPTADSGPAPEPAKSFDDLAPVERWRSIVDRIRPGDPKLGAFLDHAQVLSVERESILVSYEHDSVFPAGLDPTETRLAVTRAARELLGSSPSVELKFGANGTSAETVFEQDRQAREAKRKQAIEQARQHPAVLEAVRVFGARIKGIELPDS